MILQRNHNRPEGRPGVVLVLACIAVAVILGCLALSLDGGALMSERRKEQAAADATALAAACDLYENYWTNFGADPANTALKSAVITAKANGYVNNGNTVKVAIIMPPATGRWAGVRGYVEVVIETKQARGFSRMFGSDSNKVSARAVAIGQPVAADVGILVLNPHLRGAFQAQGGGISDVKDTPIIVNSDHTEAAIAGGGGIVKSE
jgi:uncharacterized membrane protein